MQKLIQLLTVVFFTCLVTQVTADTDDAGHGKDYRTFHINGAVEDGVIENFTVNLNEKSLGHRVKAFVEVNVDRQSTDLAKDFRRKVLEHPQVQACHMVSGSIDFMLEVVASDLDAFGRFIDGDLLSMPAVKDASSSIVLNVVKPRRTMITGAK